MIASPMAPSIQRRRSSGSDGSASRPAPLAGSDTPSHRFSSSTLINRPISSVGIPYKSSGGGVHAVAVAHLLSSPRRVFLNWMVAAAIQTTVHFELLGTIEDAETIAAGHSI